MIGRDELAALFAEDDRQRASHAEWDGPTVPPSRNQWSEIPGAGHAERAAVRAAAWACKDVDDVSTRTRPGTHMAPATLASHSCAGWQGSSPKAAPSGTSSAGVGRNHGSGDTPRQLFADAHRGLARRLIAM